MTDFVLDISTGPTVVKTRDGLLRLQKHDEPVQDLPLAEVAVVVVAHPAVMLSHGALSGLAENGAAVIVCSRSYLPVGMILPLDHHHIQAERFAQQAAASKPVCKQAWRAVVQAKIRAQAAVLRTVHGESFGLDALAGRVRSGDPTNVEAQAAQRYWRVLFDDPAFRRRRDGTDQNRYLNFGYAVMRGAVARAICAAGLHPGIGIHHRNRYNAFCLADDLIEPYRPLVDRAVVEIVREYGATADWSNDAKKGLLALLVRRYQCGSEQRTLFDILFKTTSSLAAVFDGRQQRLEVAEVRV